MLGTDWGEGGVCPYVLPQQLSIVSSSGNRNDRERTGDWDVLRNTSTSRQ